MMAATIFMELSRWVFVILAAYILIRCIRSLLQTKNPAEVWAYLNIKTYVAGDDGSLGTEEISVPVTHWENVIGRSKSCDIVTTDEAMSRNHGILMRDTAGNWSFRDLASKNGSFVNDHRIIGMEKGGDMSLPVDIKYGDEIRMGMSTCTLLPISLEEKNNNIKMRKSDTRPMSAGPTLAAITLFQILAETVLWLPE